VHTQRGLITIAEVQIGDQVWSFNEDTGESQWNEVTHLIQGDQEYNLVVLTLENGETIEATEEHPFFVVEKGWVAAEELTQGDVLVTKDGNVGISSVEREQRTVVVYNLTVENAHTFYIGRDGVLVHNPIGPGNPTPFECQLKSWFNPKFNRTGEPIYLDAPQRLPTVKEVQGKTAGILYIGGNITIELLSGDGPEEVFNSYPIYKDHWKTRGPLRYHVETHVAAYLRITSVKGGTLFLNNAPCGYKENLLDPTVLMGCYRDFQGLLPRGTNVTVHFPHPFDKTHHMVWNVEGIGPIF
jgi:hypothetical protein